MATGEGGPPARMQDVLTDLLRTSVSPTLKDAGLRKRGRATWWEQRPGGGWVLVTLVRDKWNSKDRVEFWGEVACWPPGTWELTCELGGGDATELPFVAANAPIDVDYNALEQPAVIRRRNRDATIEAMRQSGVEMLDIPAFLRKQAD